MSRALNIADMADCCHPARACAARGKVIKFVRCLLSVVQPKILRWRELATSRTSEHIRSFENTPIILTCTCYWADSRWDFNCFLIIRSTCRPFYLRLAVSHAHNATCSPLPSLRM